MTILLSMTIQLSVTIHLLATVPLPNGLSTLLNGFTLGDFVKGSFIIPSMTMEQPHQHYDKLARGIGGKLQSHPENELQWVEAKGDIRYWNHVTYYGNLAREYEMEKIQQEAMQDQERIRENKDYSGHKYLVQAISSVGGRGDKAFSGAMSANYTLHSVIRYNTRIDNNNDKGRESDLFISVVINTTRGSIPVVTMVLASALASLVLIISSLRTIYAGSGPNISNPSLCYSSSIGCPRLKEGELTISDSVHQPSPVATHCHGWGFPCPAKGTLRNGLKVEKFTLKVKGYPLNDAGATVNEIGASIRKVMGGTSGVLYDIFCKAAYAKLKYNSTSSTISSNLCMNPKGRHHIQRSAMLDAALAAVSKYGGAVAGYRTMLDALLPASVTLQEVTWVVIPVLQRLAAGDDPVTAFILSSEAAVAGAESTKNMQVQECPHRAIAARIWGRASEHDVITDFITSMKGAPPKGHQMLCGCLAASPSIVSLLSQVHIPVVAYDSQYRSESYTLMYSHCMVKGDLPCDETP
eukprot:Gb_32837 [translate_table: standard]